MAQFSGSTKLRRECTPYTPSRLSGVVAQCIPPPFWCMAAKGIVVHVTPWRARASSVRLPAP